MFPYNFAYLNFLAHAEAFRFYSEGEVVDVVPNLQGPVEKTEGDTVGMLFAPLYSSELQNKEHFK